MIKRINNQKQGKKGWEEIQEQASKGVWFSCVDGRREKHGYIWGIICDGGAPPALSPGNKSVIELPVEDGYKKETKSNKRCGQFALILRI